MKKLALSLVATTGMFALVGCAVTDYGANARDTVGLKTHNLTHAALGCNEYDFSTNPPTKLHPASNLPGPGGNTQQTIERLVNDDFARAASGVIACTSNCSFGGGFPTPDACPGATVGGVTTAEARDWERFIGTHAFFSEAQVLYPSQPQYQGMWVLEGVKALDSDCNNDGFSDLRVQTWFHPLQNNFIDFTCGARAQDGQDFGASAGEVSFLGDENLPDLTIETIAIDTRPGTQWGRNIQALSQGRNAPGAGYSTFWAILGRTGESRLVFAPIKKSAGLAEFYSGTSMTINVPSMDASLTGFGDLRNDGTMVMNLEALTIRGQSVTLSQPLQWEVGANHHGVKIDLRNQKTQLRELASFVVTKLDTNEPFVLDGVVKELGIKLPHASFMLSKKNIEAFLKGSGIHGDQFTSRSR